MCTLTYIPASDGYTFTHNRDERSNRPSSTHFLVDKQKDKTLYYPQDLEAKGSWMGFSDRGISACILNGGKHSYIRKERYRKSRGLVVLESLNYLHPTEFYNQSDFTGIEPFTLIIRSPHSLFAILHDERENRLVEYPIEESRIWSSTTLYTSEVQSRREQWFTSWLKTDPALNAEAIREFHLSAGEGNPENDLVMSRMGILQTVSLTQINVNENQASLYYQNFMERSKDQLKVDLR